MFEWIATWTFWNWLALASAIVLPLSALNAFLGLRARWKDWRATRSQAAFNNRLRQLKNRFELIKGYRESPVVILEILDEAVGIILTFLAAIGIFSISAYFYFAFSENSYWARIVSGVTFVIAQSLISLTLILLTKLSFFVRQIIYPIKLAKEIVKLINDGKAKSLFTEDESVLIDSLVDSGLFTEYGKESLAKYVDNFKLLKKKDS